VDVEVPAGDAGRGAVDVRAALRWIEAHLLKERPELFLAGHTMCVLHCAPVRRLHPPAASTPPGRSGAQRVCPPTPRCQRSRPGILVLINDVDWELEGKLDYELQPGDVLAFISTLHGG
jgi:hypothetical protein